MLEEPQELDFSKYSCSIRHVIKNVGDLLDGLRGWGCFVNVL